VFTDSLRGQGVLILGGGIRGVVILGILYESFIHPITNHLGDCRRRASARILTLMLFTWKCP